MRYLVLALCLLFFTFALSQDASPPPTTTDSLDPRLLPPLQNGANGAQPVVPIAAPLQSGAPSSPDSPGDADRAALLEILSGGPVIMTVVVGVYRVAIYWPIRAVLWVLWNAFRVVAAVVWVVLEVLRVIMVGFVIPITKPLLLPLYLLAAIGSWAWDVLGFFKPLLLFLGSGVFLGTFLGWFSGLFSGLTGDYAATKADELRSVCLSVIHGNLRHGVKEGEGLVEEAAKEDVVGMVDVPDEEEEDVQLPTSFRIALAGYDDEEGNDRDVDREDDEMGPAPLPGRGTRLPHLSREIPHIRRAATTADSSASTSSSSRPRVSPAASSPDVVLPSRTGEVYAPSSRLKGKEREEQGSSVSTPRRRVGNLARRERERMQEERERREKGNW